MEQNLEQIVAANLAELRRGQNWTQADLAEKINYSDKSVSKWERGDGLPDLKVMMQLADLYGVTLDCLVTEDGAKQKNTYRLPRQRVGFRIFTELLTVSIVFLFATLAYVAVATYAKVYPWTLFVWALPVSALLLTVFNARWKFRVCAIVFGSILVWTLLTSVYLQFLQYNLWMLFLIGIPAQAAILLGTQMLRSYRKEASKKRKKRAKT